MNGESGGLISDRDLKIAAGRYRAEITAKADGGRAGTLGIFDKWFLRVTTRLLAFDQDRPWEAGVRQLMQERPAQARSFEWDFARLQLFLGRWRQGRFVSYDERERALVHYVPKYGTEFGSDVLLTCQGTSYGLQWRGLPLMKTVFDFAIYPQLIAELRPKSIFEIGSGSGASAIWLADQSALVNPGCHVHSVDRVVVPHTHPGVTFHGGDCSHPDSLFDSKLLECAPHPWLVIEDAHHNVAAVLSHFHRFLRQGDYLYVEDSAIKRDDIRCFLASGRAACYAVDTKYTDFFGRNATCALDAIFLRVAD